MSHKRSDFKNPDEHEGAQDAAIADLQDHTHNMKPKERKDEDKQDARLDAIEAARMVLTLNLLVPGMPIPAFAGTEPGHIGA